MNVASGALRGAWLCASLVLSYGSIAEAQTSTDLVGRWSLTLDE